MIIMCILRTAPFRKLEASMIAAARRKPLRRLRAAFVKPRPPADPRRRLLSSVSFAKDHNLDPVEGLVHAIE